MAKVIKDLKDEIVNLKSALDLANAKVKRLEAIVLEKPKIVTELSPEVLSKVKAMEAEIQKLTKENTGYQNGIVRLMDSVKKHEAHAKKLQAEALNHETKLKQVEKTIAYETEMKSKLFFKAQIEGLWNNANKIAQDVMASYNNLWDALNKPNKTTNDIQEMIKNHPLFFMELIHKNPTILFNTFEAFFKPMWIDYKVASLAHISTLEDHIIKQKKRII